ncbi:MAG: MurNAc alpha-1-phosphate uridylyltransferase [Halieaceae bacterium]|jgi:MurNAc alpha-1-phosphate uridylyltransferase
MLLAAGKGERMRPLTLDTPKPLLSVAGRPLIEHHIRRLAAAGLREIVINVSWLGQRIIAFCGDGSRWGVDLQFSQEDQPLETAGGIVQALELLGDRPFLVVNADTWTDYPFAELAGRSLGAREARLVLVDNPEHNLPGDFSLRPPRVLARLDETLTFAGIGLYDPSFFSACRPGPQPLLPLLEVAIAEDRLLGERYGGQWTDVGTPERLAELRRQHPATTGKNDRQ